MAQRLVAVVGTARNETNRELVSGWRQLGLDARLMSAGEALARVGPRDVAIGRLDLLVTLDEVEPGLFELLRLERRGGAVLNRAFALLAAHDKLLTARLLARAGLPHPHTAHVREGGETGVSPPVVVKPRFGSWGKDVFRCDTAAELRACLHSIAERPWFRRHGAVVQELMPSPGYDLRIVVAGGTVVGAIERHPRPGEWRTNVSLGALKRRARPDAGAISLALEAAAAVGGDLVGVDLLPLEPDGYAVIELNGAVDFDSSYELAGDVFARAASALGFVSAHR